VIPLGLLALHQDIMVMTLVARRRNTTAPFKGKLLMIGDKGVYLFTQERSR